MRILLAILVAVAIAAAGAGVASYSYSLGVAQGLAQNDKLPASGPYPGYPYWYGAPFHGPFGFFGILWALLLVFLVASLLRGLFWHGRGGWGGASCRRGVPPWFDEWHRRAHESRGAGTA